jgi:high-affinity iron transporter
MSSGQGDDVKERTPVEIITNIRSLLNQTTAEYQNKNFSGASALVEEAYLENYEFIEAPLAEQNETLMEETEVKLREELRDLVKDEGKETDVQLLVEKINTNLNRAVLLLANHDTKN